MVGMDVSVRELEKARDRLQLDRLPSTQRERIKLIHGSLMYRDQRIAGFDAATLVEVIEHLDPPRLRALEQVVFASARPAAVIVTTPNVEYNVHWESLAAGSMRHRDHRFEWTRSQFDFEVSFVPIGPDDSTTGPPTQMAVFVRGNGNRTETP
jgi:3' terminal RNA ribose 2'-O-methyltransferase Hen1